jgi:hypothetical protein
MNSLVEPQIEARSFARMSDGWEAAYARLDQYLNVLGVRDKVARIQAVCQILDQAMHRAAVEPSRSLRELAVEEMDRLMEDWLERIAPEHMADRGKFPVPQQIAVLLAELPPAWRRHFLQPGPLPPECLAAMRETDLRAHPDLQRAAMIPQPLDLGPITTLAAMTHSSFFRFATGAAWLFGLIFAMVFLARHL